ncbi:imidazole glycerol phosphate synthase subunit HisF [Desulfolutivibrio sulfoxidireducens]|uniref:imidazole glycerol phosphate synthase subunit HisF n=1 Tax=Desulfolutivibrio sulfoxidireducens TaxID=2773299 RepID=UPI00159E528F|nr:HisA/HisF-related TIM barrel protein [Desulfolutivibrio sulfoxidireducens]QLA20628.1 imidazole glycerol phosphate synthase cyclase subunit [Desulfolutivibrio sulfoxidireducens]
MLKRRLIAVLVVRDGRIVQSERFRHPHLIHDDPVFAMDCFNKWAVDEIVTLNVSRSPESRAGFLDVVGRLSDKCFVPHSVGGWIEHESQARDLLNVGADKIIVNTAAYRDPRLVPGLADAFGSQCVVVSIDAKRDEGGRELVCIDRGRELTPTPVIEWARTVEGRGAGELFVNSIDHDGMRRGYDLDLMRRVKRAVTIPVIGFGGVFEWDDLAAGVEIADLDAVAVANKLHYIENSGKHAKRHLIGKGLPFRAV